MEVTGVQSRSILQSFKAKLPFARLVLALIDLDCVNRKRAWNDGCCNNLQHMERTLPRTLPRTQTLVGRR